MFNKKIKFIKKKKRSLVSEQQGVSNFYSNFYSGKHLHIYLNIHTNVIKPERQSYSTDHVTLTDGIIKSRMRFS